jgi:hypothetical protein
MEIWGYVLLFVVFIGIVIILNSLTLSSKKNAIQKRLESLEDFQTTQQVMSLDGSTGIAIDESRKKVCLLVVPEAGVISRVFSYKDLLSSEIHEDGIMLTKTNRMSQLGSALIGGLVFGPLGTVIGGVTGSTRATNKVRGLELRITVNDTQNPFHVIKFNFGIAVSQQNMLYKESLEQAQHWHNLIAVLIRRADEDDQPAILVNPPVQEMPRQLSGSLADELRKLADLRDAGVLTADEFVAQKMLLLSRAEGSTARDTQDDSTA